MSEIIVSVKLRNDAVRDVPPLCVDALVDTGATRILLPNVWRKRLGDFPRTRRAVAHSISHTLDALICSPAQVEIAGFPEVDAEVAFTQMEPHNGAYQPVLGHLFLQTCGAVVDMKTHTLRCAPVNRV